MEIKIGDIITATVSGIQPYGAFVSIDDGISGLIHISEISDGFVRDVHQFVEVNDKVTVKVIDYDPKTKQARLSLKALRSSSRREKLSMRIKPEAVVIGFDSIKEALPTWVEEKMKEINEVSQVED